MVRLDPEAVLPHLTRTPGLGPDRVVVEEPLAVPAADASALQGERVYDLEDHGSVLSLRYDSTTGGLLVVSDRWAPGWRSEVGGKEVPIHRVWGLVRGVLVPPGRGVEVRFRFTQPREAISRALTLGATAFCVILVAIGFVRSSRRARAA